MSEGEKLLELLKDRPTLKELATRLGYHPISISRMLKGEIGNEANRAKVAEAAKDLLKEKAQKILQEIER